MTTSIDIAENNFITLCITNDSHFVNFIVSRSSYTRRDLFCGLYLIPDIHRLYLEYLFVNDAVIPDFILTYSRSVQDSLLGSV